MLYSGYSVYPGLNAPLIKEEEITSEPELLNGACIICPDANILELQRTYKIEMAIPGMDREDIVIHADKNTLCIRAAHQRYYGKEKDVKEEDPNNICFNCELQLPKDADPEFASAEYKYDVLCMHIYKTGGPSRNKCTKIVVY
ncbi:MAG TPA: Hsp20/alpha crystallin family protein [Puia sp.]|nr:Hsp20/alpha crystallin family protein [Puia sp.]